MKKFTLLAATVVITLSICFCAHAGEWKQDDIGWWYDNGDSTYAKDGWNWIEGKCYYFTSDGYCLTDTTTPDGYTVDSSGAWALNGTVQTRDGGTSSQAGETGAVYSSEAFQVTIPEGFRLYEQDGDSFVFISDDPSIILYLYSTDLNLDFSSLTTEHLDSVLELAVLENLGQYTSKAQCLLSSGTWNRYNYTSLYVEEPGIASSAISYFRFKESFMQSALFTGDLSGTDTDGIMNSMVK